MPSMTPAIALALALSLTPAAHAAATSPSLDISGVLVTTSAELPAPGTGSNWYSDHHWHVRDMQVSDDLVANGEVIGHLSRSVSFDWDTDALAAGDVVSTARCSFTLQIEVPELGVFTGACRGTLLAGGLVGNGDGHLAGTYALQAGGTPGVGPYVLEVTVRD